MEMMEMRSVERFTLREPMTLDELYVLIKERWNSALPCDFKLEKSLLFKSIVFDAYMRTSPKVKIQKNVVTVYQNFVGNNNNDTYNHFDVRKIEEMARKNNAFKEAGIDNGNEYFIALCNALREVLRDMILQN